MTTPFRWGIIGTGNIADKFAIGLQAIEDAELVAIGSRSQGSADKFAERFNIPHRHASYEALANDPDVDAVYIGTPHPYHKDNSIMCLQAGKHVICEKPFTVNASETREVIQVAKAEKKFLMEAMWTRYFPVMIEVRKLLAENAIGDVMMVQVDFGFRTNVNPQGRLFNMNLAGGGLLDVGIYPISFASMVFGKQPERIATLAHLGETGVDEQAVAVFAYDHNQTAICTIAIRTNTPHNALIMGSNGMIEIPDWWHPTQFTLSVKGESPQTFTYALEGNGYNYEALELMNKVRAGELESDIMPLDETLAIMETLDAIRKEWGLVYPME